MLGTLTVHNKRPRPALTCKTAGSRSTLIQYTMQGEARGVRDEGAGGAAASRQYWGSGQQGVLQ